MQSLLMPKIPCLRVVPPGLAIAVCLLGVACTNNESPPANDKTSKTVDTATPPPKEKKELSSLKVEQQKRHFVFTPARGPVAKLRYFINHKELSLHFADDATAPFPIGTILSLDESTDEKQSKLRTLGGVTPLLLVPGTTPYLAFTEDRTIALANTLTVTVPRHKPLTVSLEKFPVLHTLLPDLLSTVTNGPMRFFNESEADDKSSLVYVPSNNRDMHIVGTQPQEVQDIDWIALTDDPQVVSEKTCSGYSGKNSKLVIEFKDTRVRIYERRTGTLQLEDRIAPPKKKKCPEYIVGVKDGKSSVHIKDEQVAAWLTKKLKSLKKG